jgi:tripartite-type tricarboxylate transporter receptor subunit TctC
MGQGCQRLWRKGRLIFVKRRQLLLAAGGVSIGLNTPAQTNVNWPNKVVRLIVPFAPGGTSEIVARSVAAEMSKALGQNIFVENKPGGAGVVAMLENKNSPADGHTLVLGHVGTLAVNPYMLANQPFDVNKDFIPITMLAKVPNAFVIHPDVPANNFKEFIDYLRKNPGKLNYGSAGNASAGHLSMEYLKLVTGTFITHIPYRGTGPQLADLLAGRIQASSTGLPAIAPHIRSGKLRAIAVGSGKRISAFPDLPTVEEMGYKGFETSQWYGLLAPADTPTAVVTKIQESVALALRSSAVTERFATDNAVGGGGPSADFAQFIAKEQSIWKDIVRRAAIKAD